MHLRIPTVDVWIRYVPCNILKKTKHRLSVRLTQDLASYLCICHNKELDGELCNGDHTLPVANADAWNTLPRAISSSVSLTASQRTRLVTTVSCFLILLTRLIYSNFSSAKSCNEIYCDLNSKECDPGASIQSLMPIDCVFYYIRQSTRTMRRMTVKPQVQEQLLLLPHSSQEKKYYETTWRYLIYNDPYNLVHSVILGKIQKSVTQLRY